MKATRPNYGGGGGGGDDDDDDDDDVDDDDDDDDDNNDDDDDVLKRQQPCINHNVRDPLSHQMQYLHPFLQIAARTYIS